MTRKEKRLLNRILIAGVFFALALPIHQSENIFRFFGLGIFQSPLLVYIEFPAFLLAYLVIGWDIVWKAVRNIRKGQIFDENFLMTIASIGAFLLGEYAEGVAVLLFYQVGELFQSYAVSRSRRSIGELMNIRPDYANVMRDGAWIRVDPTEVSAGNVIMVKPGERVPLDGVVEEGRSALDTSALTGESVPRDVAAGDSVISGCVNRTGMLIIKVSREFGQSTVAKILELVENASDKKSRSENFITRFARYYTPLVVFAALILAVVPPLVTGQAFSMWTRRALAFLVVSCPCALVISVPLSFFGGIGGASRCGVLVKGSNYLELLAKTETVVFDKTGTLTKGNFEVSEIRSAHPGVTGRQELLRLAAHAENYSGHPIALSIKKAWAREIDADSVTDIEETAGCGVKALIDGRTVLAGNAGLMNLKGIPYDVPASAGTVVHLAVDGQYAGNILIADEIKPDAAKAVRDLKAVGVRKTVMLTGDADAVGREVAALLNLDEVYTELLPAGKVEQVEKLMRRKLETGVLAFVGDGINDAPVLARADIGIAMGGLGSDAAIEAADIVIMTDEPSKIATAVKISKKTLGIVRQNIAFALLTKAAVLALSAVGLASMWGAVFADVGVSIIAILNATRALNVSELSRPALTSSRLNAEAGTAA